MDASVIDSGRVAGVVVDAGRGRVFVGADQAIGALAEPRLCPVARAPLSLLWFEGEVLVAIPFLSCVDGGAVARRAEADGERPPHVLIGELGGQRYGLTDLVVLAGGSFERAPLPQAPREEPSDAVAVMGDAAEEGVRFEGAVIPSCRLSLPSALSPGAMPGLKRESGGPGADGVGTP